MPVPGSTTFEAPTLGLSHTVLLPACAHQTCSFHQTVNSQLVYTLMLQQRVQMPNFKHAMHDQKVPYVCMYIWYQMQEHTDMPSAVLPAACRESIVQQIKPSGVYSQQISSTI